MLLRRRHEIKEIEVDPVKEQMEVDVKQLRKEAKALGVKGTHLMDVDALVEAVAKEKELME